MQMICKLIGGVMFENIKDFFLDALIDSAKLVPFLYVIYLVMEILEHKAGNRFFHVDFPSDCCDNSNDG